jgi:zinc protease
VQTRAAGRRRTDGQQGQRLHVKGIEPGYIAVYVATSPGQVEEAKAAIHEQLQTLVRDGVTAEELGRAQRCLVGTHAIALQRRSSVAATLAVHEAQGQGWRAYRHYDRRIMQVTRQDVSRAARRYLDPRREVTALVTPPDTRRRG